MSCPKLKIPWPRVIGEDPPNVDHDQENWKALERWSDGILKCIPTIGTDVAAILYAEDMGGTVNSENFDPDFTIISQTGGFSNAASVITVPEEGLYVWRLYIYWFTYPSLSGGTDGVSYGGWYTDVAGGGSYTDHISLTPFTKDGGSPAGLRYFSTAGIVGAFPTVTVNGGPQFYSYASVSGTTTWDMYFTLAKVSSLTETPPA